MTAQRKKPDTAPAKGADDSPDEPTNPGGGKTRVEIGGRKGLDPTRYGDWEKGGRAIDF